MMVISKPIPSKEKWKFTILFRVALILALFVSLAPSAFPWDIEGLTKIADSGHIDSQYLLGIAFLFGVQGCKQDVNKAIHYFSMAANRNHWPSQEFLGDIFDNIGPQQDHKKALEWYYKASKSNSKNAYRELYWHYHLGIGVPKDDVIAFSWLRKLITPTNFISHMYYIDELFFDWEIIRKCEIFHTKQVLIECVSLEAEKLKNSRGDYDHMICYRPATAPYFFKESIIHNVYEISAITDIDDLFEKRKLLLGKEVKFIGVLRSYRKDIASGKLIGFFSSPMKRNSKPFLKCPVRTIFGPHFQSMFAKSVGFPAFIKGILLKDETNGKYFIDSHYFVFDNNLQ